MNISEALCYSLGLEMMSCVPHPARRKGEANCRGPGRDWGASSHILPGRRVNEPNHQAWQYLVENDTHDTELTESGVDGFFSDYIDEASVAVTRTFEDSFRMLKSVMEMMAFIEGLRVMRHDGAVAPKADKRLERLSNDTFANKQDQNSSQDRSGWSSEFMVQLHNMCASGQKTRPDHLNVTECYGTFLEPEHEILPPKSPVTRYKN
jgi:hypothetical protein